MSPNRQLGCREPSGFPRVSGDEPLTQDVRIERLQFSPRERG